MARVVTDAVTRAALSAPQQWGRWWAALAVVLALLVVAGSSARAPAMAPGARSAAVAAPTFVPHLGDVDDAGDGLFIAAGSVPTFQFKDGGTTLSGAVVDAATTRAISGVSVWIALPPVAGQRTSAALRAVSTASGTFSFAHLAPGTYNLAAARYTAPQGQSIYPEVTLTNVALPRGDAVRLALTPWAAPGNRSPASGGARNLIILDLRGIYAASWFDDPALQLAARNVRALAASGAQATQVAAPYGWHPADQYALLSGTYPAWRVYDPWPDSAPWGTPDGMDTTFWYESGSTTLEFGQESLFDVAERYGMSTAALGGPTYLLSDVSTRGVQTAQVGLTFEPVGWLASAEHLIASMEANPNGFVFYGALEPPLGPSGALGVTPDAPGGGYMQAMEADDQLVGLLRDWLAREHLLANSVILLTASEAQITETAADNYYGMGSSGRGSSLDVPLVLSGDGVAPGGVERQPIPSFVVAPTALRALCLPPPANARAGALVALFATPCS